MANRVPVEEGLFTWPADDPRLIGSRCSACGVVTFPTQNTCPRCFGDAMSDVQLPKRGTLWTWTTQGFLPKGPPEGTYLGGETSETFTPFAVGYVEIPDHCKVETRLTESDPDKLTIGMEMELAIVPFRTDDQGNEVVTFAFKPVS